MKRRTAGPKIIIAAFAVVICAVWALWLPLEKTVGFETHENREKAQPPALTAETYMSYAKEYEAYFNDYMPFRSNLIQINSWIDYFIFHKSSNEEVIVADDNWLFYNSKTDGDPMGSYAGQDLYSEEELAQIAANCVAQRNFLAEQGKEFVLFIAPNKERIYSDLIPAEYGEPAADYGALQVYRYLKENTDLRVVYPVDEVIAAKNKVTENICYKTDTHWNDIGGYVAACALLKEMGIEMPQIDDSRINIITEGETSGDLAWFLNLSRQLAFADHEYKVTGYDDHNVTEEKWDFYTDFIYHAENADPRTLYVIRDSFMSNMSPYVGSQFAHSYMKRVNDYSYEDLQSHDPDIVVYETVERYIGNLKTFSL